MKSPHLILLAALIGITSAEADELIAIKGHCFSETGKPIVGARVSLVGGERGKPVEALGASFSDKHGAFAFQKVERLERLVLAVRATGHASRLHYLREPADAGEIEVEIALETNPGTLTGIVTGPDGKPLEGVFVHAASGLNAPIAGVMMDVTNEQGRYVINDLRRWEAQARGGIAISHAYFWLRHPDFATTRATYSSIPAEVNVTLETPAIIGGQVIDEVTGKPMPDVLVSAQGITASHWHQTRTDKDGRYQLRTNREYFNIWAEAADRIPIAVKAIEAVPGTRTQNADLRMVRGGYVVGTIEEFKGPPARSLRVAHYGPARPATGAAVTSTTLNEDGSFRLHVAPGRNYVYLMNGTASVYVTVGDGQEVQAALVPGHQVSPDERSADPDVMLARILRLKARNRQLAKEAADRDAARVPGAGARVRRNTPTGRLLDKLEDRNQTAIYRGPWCQVMIEIAELGPQAVPELIEELDETSSQKMMRCLGFLLRAIGDKRAVPALIRALPKTLIEPSSDMGLRADDEEVAEFFQQHDLDAENRDNQFGFGRPVREVCGALQKLSGQQFGESELFHMHRNGTENQVFLKQQLYHRVAKQWSDWWETNAADMVDDKKYHAVNLPPFDLKPPTAIADADALYKTGGGGGNMMLQSVYNIDARECFYDLDTGRYAKVPERWQGNTEKLAANLANIKAWAIGEGFDLMGLEFKGNGESEDCFVIEPLKLQLWELPQDRWKMRSRGITLAELQDEGRASDALLHVDPDNNAIDREAHAPFLYITADGTAGLLFLGISVTDNTLKAGGSSAGDDELRPIAFRKGRRFAVRDLIPIE